MRALCDKYGILLIADEVMAGFGRTGEWFAVDHWHVVPDLITMAKGLTSAYVQLGAVGMRRPIADHFQNNVFSGGLTYNSHPLACAAALATIAVYEEDDLIDNARSAWAHVMATLLADLQARHPSVGAVALHRPLRHRGAGAQIGRRASRWRPSTARRPRWRRSASSSARRASTRSCAGTPSSRIRRSVSREEQLREGFAIIDRGLRS